MEIREINSAEIDPKLGLVWISYSSHTLLDSDLNPLPYARTFDYIGTPFSTRQVDLSPEFVEFLRSHPWVVNKSDLSPRPIPYYNNDSGDDMYIPVTLLPDQKTYREMWSYYESEKNPSCWVKDALCGANALFNDEEPDWFGIRPWLRD